MLRQIQEKIKRSTRKILDHYRFKELVQLRSLFSGDEAYWTLSHDDALALASIIKKHAVKKVLELGGGIGAGTLGIAWALPPDGIVDSVEQVQNCIHRAQKLIPEPYLKKVRFHHSKTIITEPFRHNNAISYADIPKGHYDMIVIDGPSFHVENGEFTTTLPRGDIFSLLPGLRDGTIIYIDGSETTVKLLTRFYSDCLIKRPGYFIKQGVSKKRDNKKEALLKHGFTLE